MSAQCWDRRRAKKRFRRAYAAYRPRYMLGMDQNHPLVLARTHPANSAEFLRERMEAYDRRLAERSALYRAPILVVFDEIHRWSEQ